MKIEELELSARTYNTLKRAGINDVEHLRMMREGELLKIRHMGVGSVREIKEKLSAFPDSTCLQAIGMLQRYLDDSEYYTKEFISTIHLAVDALKLMHQLRTDSGEVSDGFHTFNELYHHRAILFNVICRMYRERAWKSKLHHDGTMFDGMFIVGIDTPLGQATYHYDVKPYWNLYDVPELERAPVWDGHTSEEAICRIGALGRFGT